MSAKTKTKKTVKPKKKTSVKKVRHNSLLITNQIFATERQQLIVSLLMLTVLIIQVYLFISIFRLVEEVATLQGL